MSRTKFQTVSRRPAAQPRPSFVLPRRSVGFALLAALAGTACDAGPESDTAAATVSDPTESLSSTRVGIEVLLRDSLHLVQGQRVGLVTNHTGIYWASEDAAGEKTTASVIDALVDAPGVEVVALFGPEHGLRGEEEAGARVDDSVDERTGIPIHSLYGATLRPTPEMLEGIDVLVFDMQDIGARYYTYVSTMAYAMEAAGEAGIRFVVLDRPNPIRGDVVQGSMLEPDFSTFVGLYPVPMRHGMTAGELARMYVGEFGIDVELSVVPMDGWNRSMIFDETGLPWVAPSPNMPDVASALAYPGTCLFEGTPLSVGRGTDRAFQWVGAPWLDGGALADRLNEYGIPGVRFEAVRFTPEGPGDGKFDGVEVEGVRLVAENTAYDAPRAAVAMLVETLAASGDQWDFRVAHFDRLAGTDALRFGLEAGAGVDELTALWDTGVTAFEERRAPYLLYR